MKDFEEIFFSFTHASDPIGIAAADFMLDYLDKDFFLQLNKKTTQLFTYINDVIKNIEKPYETKKFFKDLRGLGSSKMSPETIKNQSREAKRPKVRPKSGPSAEQIKKKRKSRGLGPKRVSGGSQKSGSQPQATIRGGSPPPSSSAYGDLNF